MLKSPHTSRRYSGSIRGLGILFRRDAECLQASHNAVVFGGRPPLDLVKKKHPSTSSAEPADHQGIVHLIVQPQLSNARTAEDESAKSAFLALMCRKIYSLQGFLGPEDDKIKRISRPHRSATGGPRGSLRIPIGHLYFREVLHLGRLS